MPYHVNPVFDSIRVHPVSDSIFFYIFVHVCMYVYACAYMDHIFSRVGTERIITIKLELSPAISSQTSSRRW
jgi:uncharacterized protein YqhQ